MRPVHLSATALITIAIPVFGIFAIPVLKGSLHASPAEAQSKVKELIDRLRHGTMPEGIAKSNGRVEATQIDVAPKYTGRLEEVTVQEGDEVTAG